MTERVQVTRAMYDVTALTTYVDEFGQGAKTHHFVFAKPYDTESAVEHLRCTLPSLFQVLVDKQDEGYMLYLEIAEGIFCVPAGTPDLRLDPPVTLALSEAREIAILSKDVRASEWTASASTATPGSGAGSSSAGDGAKKRGRPPGSGNSGKKRRGEDAEPVELVPPLGPEHAALLERRGWTRAMIESSGLGTITDAETLASLSPRGAAAAPYGLVLPYGLNESGAPTGRRVQLEVPDMGDRTALERASVWDRATLGPYVPAPVVKDARLQALVDDPLVVVFDELDAHVFAELGRRVIGVERLEAMRIRVEGVETLHPTIKSLVPVAGVDVLIVGYPAVPGKRLLEARRAGRWLYDAGASRVRFLGVTQASIAECVADPSKWTALDRKASSLDRDTCGEPYTTLRDALPADVAADASFAKALNLYVPEGYDIDPNDGTVSTVRPAGYANGVEMTKQVLVSRSPIVPVARVITAQPYRNGGAEDITEESIETCIVAHRRDTGWTLLHVPMRSLCTKQGVVSLREYGIAASEHNAVELVGWFHHFLEINTLHARMPVTPRFTELGWHMSEPGVFTFALPNATTGQYAAAPSLVTSSSPALEGYGVRGGTRAGQYAVLRRATTHSSLRFAVTEVFRSMIVPMLGGNRSRCIHFYGTTTSGKSLGLYTALNIYGKGQQLEIKGSSTMTGLERQMASRNHTTIYVDDILHKTAEERESLLYMASDGRGKTRATKEAEVRRTSNWVAGLITTGEKPLQDDGMAQGAQARAFELEYAPLDPDLVNDLMDGIHHYGHVIHDWVALTERFLALVPKYTWELRDLTVAFRAAANARGVNARTGDLMAEIIVTHRILVELGMAAELGIPDDNGEGLRALLYSDVHMQAPVRAEHLEAFEALQSYMLNSRHQIVSVHDTTPRQTIVARIHGDDALLVEKRWLQKFLQKEGFNSRNVIRKWIEDRTTSSTQRRTPDGRPKFYQFKLVDVLGTQADQQGSYDAATN